MVKSKRELPEWYYRLVRLTIKHDREIYPEDFDEDLSSISSSVDSETNDNNDDDDKEENEDEETDEDDDDSVSNRSYDGSDADYYYELKEEREERKLELRDMRRREEQAKNDQRAFEREKEMEVQKLYDSLENSKKQDKTPLGSILGTFTLYSVDHVDHFYSSIYRSKYIAFYQLDMDNTSDSPPVSQNTQVNGHFYFDSDSVCHFNPFSAPKHAGLDKIRLGTPKEYELVLQILSRDYAKLKVPREVFFKKGDDVPADAPMIFEFFGIRYDWKKEMEKRKAERKRKRSVSPKESLFDLNHDTW